VVGDDRTTRLCLCPQPRTLADEEEIYRDLQLPFPKSPLLPYVLVNMVSSVDGRSSVGGKAAGIGSRADREAMRALRSHVDAVMVGAGTLRAEKLNLGLDDPDARQPLAVIVGGTGDLPVRERLTVRQQCVILTVPEGPRVSAEAGVDRLTVIEAPRTGQGRVDLRWLLEYLRAEQAVGRLLVEGGPELNRAMIDAGLADEIFLTLAPKLLSGKEAAIVRGYDGETTGRSRNLDLLSVHISGSELFLRYRLESPR
jgi:2,5-diamino-6-(ribosylamino)-4(3H)-pyrimidinone 5'-phosphate reductase